ncbi:MAG TPA: hypothetical protein VL197_03750 [Nitrospirota bacterium]|nr:hypothetical protein [Nitrospirota bacterium]
MRLLSVTEGTAGEQALSSPLCLHRPPRVLALLFLVYSLFILSPVSADTSDDDIEGDLQKDLGRSKIVAHSGKADLTQGIAALAQLSRLRTVAVRIPATYLLPEERFTLQEKNTYLHGLSAVDQDRAVSDGYRKALRDYLSLVKSHFPMDDPSINAKPPVNVLNIPADTICLKKTDTLIIGSLLNILLNGALEPAGSPGILATRQVGYKTINISQQNQNLNIHHAIRKMGRTRWGTIPNVA